MKSEQSFDKDFEETVSEKMAMSQNSLKSEKQFTSLKSTQDQFMQQEEPMTEEDVNLLKKIFSEFRDFKVDKENKIQLNNPTRRIILQTLSLWKKRPIRHPNYMLTLVISEPKFEKDKLLQELQPFASLKLVIDGQEIENKRAIHKLENNTYYEGIDGEYMFITKTNGEVIDYYEGTTKNFVENGQGILYHTIQGKNAWQYIGDFVDGKRCGKGKEVSTKGTSYEGEFKDDFKHGKGMEILIKRKKNPQTGQQPYVQKNRYIGQFQYGYKEGEGVQITPHGQYKGQWHEGAKHGKGTIKYKKGDSYEGDWVNNCQHGEGTYIQMVLVNDEEKFNKFTGQFKEGFYYGKGVMEYWNGDKYEGEWAFGKKDGEGMYEWADGDYYDGHWEKDSAEGTGAACFGGIFYDGEFHLGQKHGLGEETDADGNTVKAMWQSGKIIKKLQVNGELVQEDQ